MRSSVHRTGCHQPPPPHRQSPPRNPTRAQNDYGQFDGLIQVLQPALGPAGLEHLKRRVTALSAEPVRKPGANERHVIGWGPGGPLYADEIAERSRVGTVRLALQDIADAQGDVDSFIAQYVYAPERKSLTEVAGLSGRAGVKFRREEALCVERRGLGDEGRGTVWAGPLRGSD